MLAMEGLPQTMPMDFLILNKAKEAGQDLQFLELAQFQLDLLDKVMTIEFLKEMLDNPDASDSQKMLDAYRKGDLEALEEMTNDPEAWGSEEDAKQNMELIRTRATGEKGTGSDYAFVFIIILQQDLSLLLGSIGLFIVVGLLMYFSRKINWYREGIA